MKKGFIIVIVLMLSALAVASNAATITQTDSFSYLSGDTLFYDITGFDTSIGTLNSVSINIVVETNGAWFVENTGPSTVHTNGKLASDTVGYFTLSTVSDSVKADIKSKWNDFLSPGGSDSWAGSSSKSKTDTYTIGSTDLSQFEDTWQIFYTNDSKYRASAHPATVFTGADAYGNGSYTVVYDYTPVPEPASLLGLLTGTCGLLGFAWRRRKA